MLVIRRGSPTLCALWLGIVCFAQTVQSQSPTYTFVGSFTASTIRNNYSGFVGMEFTVGTTPLYVSQLGHIYFPNNLSAVSQNHVVKLVNAVTGVDIPNGSVTVTPSSPASSNFLYASLPAPLLLTANTTYLLLSQETAGGDSWYDETPVQAFPAIVNAAVYQDASGKYVPVPGSAGYCYGPVNFQFAYGAPASSVVITSPAQGSTVTGDSVTYSATVTPGTGLTIASVQFELGDSSGQLTNFGPALTQAPYTLQESTSALTAGAHTLTVAATDSLGIVTTASTQFTVATGSSNLITGFSGNSVRNNYTGFVGLQFTTGSTPLIVTSLGRLALPGNNGTHTLKLVQNFQDVYGIATATITMTPGNGTTFQYAPLSYPVTLAANTSYFLLSQETSGGDTWYDYSPVSGISSGIEINGAAYSTNSSYVVVPNTASYSYVPVNLTLSAGGATAGTIIITSPANNSFFSNGSITFSANATPANGLSIASVQYVIAGTMAGDFAATNLGPALTTAPYTLNVDSGLINGDSYTLTALAIDSGGNTMTSAPVSFEVAADTLPFLGSVVNPATVGGYQTGQYFGMEFTVGPAPLKVVQLGFYFGCCYAQNQGFSVTKSLKLVDAATGLDIPGGLTTATSSRADWAYGRLPAPITLQANKSYYLVSQQANALYVNGASSLAPFVTPGAGTVNFPVYQSTQNTYVVGSSLPGYSYDVLNFQYDSATPLPPVAAITAPATNTALSGTVHVIYSATPPYGFTLTSVKFQVDGTTVDVSAGTLDTTAFSNGAHVLTVVAIDSQGTAGTSPPINVTFSNTTQSSSNSPAFVSSFSPAALRNNYSGFLGFKFTVGPVPLQISSLGRVCVAGNTGSHTVKLVQSSNGSDVAGASVSVALSGCAAGKFVYSALASPVTLAASSSYYLVDQETAGLDQWYDYLPVTTATAATVNGPVYASGSQWVTVNAPGASYVPLNFLFSAAPATANPGFAVTLISNSGIPPVRASVTSNLPVAGVQYLVDGIAFGSPVTSANYFLPAVPALNVGTHIIVAVAQDSAGNTATSAPIFIPFSGLTDVIGFTPTTLRNNFSGWVGLRLTTGVNPYLISGPQPSNISVGRLCSAGNSMVHLVKLVNASSGVDVPNAVGWINMSGCSAGTYLDAVLSNVTLAANTSYYLVSQEVSGGDSWYDVSPALPLNSVLGPPAFPGYSNTPISANFTIDGPVYSAADGSLVFVSLPNYSFVGLSVGGYSPSYCPGIDNCF